MFIGTLVSYLQWIHDLVYICIIIINKFSLVIWLLIQAFTISMNLIKKVKYIS